MKNIILHKPFNKMDIQARHILLNNYGDETIQKVFNHLSLIKNKTIIIGGVNFVKFFHNGYSLNQDITLIDDKRLDVIKSIKIDKNSIYALCHVIPQNGYSFYIHGYTVTKGKNYYTIRSFNNIKDSIVNKLKKVD